MKINIIISVIFVIFLINIASAIQLCETYDDFSSGNLNLSKWTELGGSDINNLFTDEHFVNGVEGVYHTAQLTEGDRASSIKFNRNFSIGEILEYDIHYQSGNGNVLSRLFVNGQAGDTGLQTRECEGQGFATGGALGYWNGLSCVGQNAKGLYHVRMIFNDNSVDVNFTDPNNNVISYRPIFYVTHPYSVMVGTRTGHNGIVHMDYDNFQICKEEKDSDNDGVIDSLDLCPNTIMGTEVDSNGCSALQFCNSFNPIITHADKNMCKSADWKDNEGRKPKDCLVVKQNDQLRCIASQTAN